MKRSHRPVACVATFVCLATAVAAMVAEPSRIERWKRVDAAVAKGLPQTAIAELDPILAGALRDKAYPEAIKAVCKKIELEAKIQGDKPEEKIARMRVAIEAAPAEMHPVMHAVLAHWYWQYLDKNEPRIAHRTAGGDATGLDVTTWDIVRILEEVDRQFDAALANEKELKATPIGCYDALLERGTFPDAYRPTLFDFVAFEALNYYASWRTGPGSRNSTELDEDEITASSPMFAPLDEFLKWDRLPGAPSALTHKAIRLYQNVLAFHEGELDSSARLAADLHRLQFAYEQGNGAGNDEAYVATLKRFVAENASHELSALARARWAEILKQRNDLVEARAIALVGAKAYPDSNGGHYCHNLVQEIEARTLAVDTEKVWGDPRPEIRIHYTNLTRIHFRVVEVDIVDQLQSGFYPLKTHEPKVLLGLKAKFQFAHDLPPTTDYRARTEMMPSPKGIGPGLYYLISSASADFGSIDNCVSVTEFWVSDLAIVSQFHFHSHRVDGLVVDGKSGQPIKGAKAQVWFQKSGEEEWIRGGTTTTDKNGLYSLIGRAQHRYLVLVTHGSQMLASNEDFDGGQNPDLPLPQENTVFFTDRSLYRPGQSIQFKGICIRFDNEEGKYETIANRDVVVVFEDANRKEVAQHRARTNEFGSFSGSFAAPRDRLAGRMRIVVKAGPPGGAQVAVEEYKRPKFSVVVSVPFEPAKLNARIAVPGKATSYAGVPIGGAKVVYRVVRSIGYRAGYSKFNHLPGDPRLQTKEVSRGTTTTDRDGSFAVPFTARPDPNVPEAEEPAFHYAVIVDVTDASGETRSDQAVVKVGYSTILATVQADEWQVDDKDVAFAISATSLDGVGQEVAGTLKVYRLRQPAAIIRPGIADDPPGLKYELEESWLPTDHRREPQPSWPANWEAGAIEISADFRTDRSGHAKPTAKLPSGAYRVVVELRDPFGKLATAKTDLVVLNPMAARLDVKVPQIVSSPAWTVEP